MRQSYFLAAGLVLTMLAVLGVVRPADADEMDLSMKWKEGIRIQNQDKTVKLKLGGRLMYDWTVFLSPDEELEDAVGELEDGTEFRRARLYASGEIFSNLEFKAQYDFAGGDADIKDMYIGLKKLPFGKLRIGHFKEPFSLEELTSSKYITFMERSLPNALAPGRNNGVMIHDAVADKRITYAVGFFREADDFGEENGDDNAFSYTGRITALPWYEEEGRKLFHVGAAYSYRNIDDDLTRIRTRPEVHNSPRFVDTGEFNAESASLVGAELALVLASFSVQAEYAQSFLDSPSGTDGSDPSFPSYYVYASYFFTGENRAYKPGKGAFARVNPDSPYIAAEPGAGAWELAARYSWIDLDDKDILGGELSDVSVGINWYLHSNARFMLNWVHADVDKVGDADILQTRVQVDF